MTKVKILISEAYTKYLAHFYIEEKFNKWMEEKNQEIIVVKPPITIHENSKYYVLLYVYYKYNIENEVAKNKY